jgi:hypothetical protein
MMWDYPGDHLMRRRMPGALGLFHGVLGTVVGDVGFSSWALAVGGLIAPDGLLGKSETGKER